MTLIKTEQKWVTLIAKPKNCGKNDTMQGDCVENKVNVTVTWVEK